MPNHGAVWDHFASAIAAYRRAADAEKWTPVEIDARNLGEYSVFATVHWNALDANGQVVRDTWTSYQLLATPDGFALPLVHESLLSRAGWPAYPPRDIPECHWPKRLHHSVSRSQPCRYLTNLDRGRLAYTLA
jgi:hypothetical protein